MKENIAKYGLVLLAILMVCSEHAPYGWSDIYCSIGNCPDKVWSKNFGKMRLLSSDGWRYALTEQEFKATIVLPFTDKN